MDELTQVLSDHAARYPLMEPTDAVKLIYQNEFGGGHMIRDENACLAYLRQEFAETEWDCAKPLTEDIGNGIVRVNLAALPPDRLEELGRAFIRSARYQGSMERFKNKLSLLRSVTTAGQFSFDLVTLDTYLAAYEEAGFPAVSHSNAYRNAYKPAYRIVYRKNRGICIKNQGAHFERHPGSIFR